MEIALSKADLSLSRALLVALCSRAVYKKVPLTVKFHSAKTKPMYLKNVFLCMPGYQNFEHITALLFEGS